MVWYIVEHDEVCLLHPHTKIGTAIVFFTIIFNISSVCSHDNRRVERSLRVLCIRAFRSVFIDVVPNFDTMHSGSDQD